jgi:DHA2 family multidrug resistance protein
MSQAVLLDVYPPAEHARAMAIWVMGITVGPILGPALGGWLTENYNWRWVFYINVPFGILCFLGTVSFMAETRPRRSRFDFFGFAALSVAIGALQLMLDRGQLKDWFNSTQIWATAIISGTAFYLFIVHMLTTKEASFVSPALFKDRNFLTGNVFIFFVGMVLFATLALLPPLLQELLSYPVVLAGFVTAPRGFGTLAAMFLVGRLMGKIDIRLIIGVGFAVCALSVWQMTGFYLQMGTSKIIWTGLEQGFGSGMVYVPLSAVAFATLPPAYRNEGTAFFSLVRNLGSSIGISAVTTLLTRNTQAMHSRLAEHVTAYGDVLHLQPPGSLSTVGGLAALNRAVTGQATMLAYNNDFKLMLAMLLCAIPLVLLLTSAKAKPGVPAVVVE